MGDATSAVDYCSGSGRRRLMPDPKYDPKYDLKYGPKSAASPSYYYNGAEDLLAYQMVQLQNQGKEGADELIKHGADGLVNIQQDSYKKLSAEEQVKMLLKEQEEMYGMYPSLGPDARDYHIQAYALKEFGRECNKISSVEDPMVREKYCFENMMRRGGCVWHPRKTGEGFCGVDLYATKARSYWSPATKAPVTQRTSTTVPVDEEILEQEFESTDLAGSSTAQHASCYGQIFSDRRLQEQPPRTAQDDDLARMELRSSELSLRYADVKNSNSRATRQARQLSEKYVQGIRSYKECVDKLKRNHACGDLLGGMLTELSSARVDPDRKVLSFFKCDDATAAILEEAICALEGAIIPSLFPAECPSDVPAKEIIVLWGYGPTKNKKSYGGAKSAMFEAKGAPAATRFDAIMNGAVNFIAAR